MSGHAAQARRWTSLGGWMASFALCLVCSGPALASAFDLPGLQAPVGLQVTLPGVESGGVLPINYAADGRNLSPPIGWSGAPQATASYAVIMEADGGDAPVRWLAYNIPKTLSALPRGLHNMAEPAHPVGLLQGRNDHGGFGYAGPRPAPGALPRTYRFEVFAMDRALRLGGGATLPRLEAAMAGHVLARGELDLTYPPPPHAPARSQPGPSPGESPSPTPAAAPQT
jgi:Raf kinase inhibitor-like YbhB/YbcL family protein